MTVAEARGLLIRGERVEIPGLTVIGPGDAPWAHLSPRDYRKRAPGDWLRQIFVHTTKGIWPQPIIAGPDPEALARIRAVAEYWSGDPKSGGAAIVVDSEYVACLCDLVLDEPYHATTSNPWSIGIEMFQRADGGIHERTLETTTFLCGWLCGRLGIAFQIPDRVYDNDAIARMKYDGGPDMVGIFGHRDNAWDFEHKTSSRGRGDPGDEIYRRLALAGAERFDFERRQDIATWKRRQLALNELGEHLVVDGIAGPATSAAHRRHAAQMPR